MVKEKQKSDPEILADSIKSAHEEVQKEDPLVAILKGLKLGQEQINANVQQLGKNDKILSDRMDNMEKNPPKKDILTQGIEVINAIDKTGLFRMLGDALGGGDKQDAITTSQVPPEGYAEYVKFTKGMQNTVLDQAKQVVRKMTLSNDQAEKDLGSDF